MRAYQVDVVCLQLLQAVFEVLLHIWAMMLVAVVHAFSSYPCVLVTAKGFRPDLLELGGNPHLFARNSGVLDRLRNRPLRSCGTI